MGDLDGKASINPYVSKVDLTNASRGIWLVKVPKYLASRWEKIPGNVEAGKLRLSRVGPGQKPKVTLSLSEATLCLEEGEIPKEHEMFVQPVSNQTLGVFSVNPANADITDGSEIVDPDKIAIEGKIQTKLECRPIADQKYIDLKKKEANFALQSHKEVIQIEYAVNTFKPISNHKHNIEYEEKKKAEGKKSRDDKDKVLEMLYAAFEKHQYYNVKDLVRITNQPIGFVKELLKEYCSYCVKNPHKNMWELKPEYRHYKSNDDDD